MMHNEDSKLLKLVQCEESYLINLFRVLPKPSIWEHVNFDYILYGFPSAYECSFVLMVLIPTILIIYDLRTEVKPLN